MESRVQPLGDDNLRKNRFRMIGFVLPNLTILSLSFFLSQTLQLDVIRETILISLAGIFIMFFFNYKKDTSSLTNQQIIKNPVPIQTIIIAIWLVLKLPYLSFVFIFLFGIIFITNLYGRIINKRWSGSIIEIIISIALPTYIIVILLNHEERVQLPWTILLLPLALGLIVTFVFYNYFTILEISKNKLSHHFIYSRTFFSSIFDLAFINCVLTVIILLFSKLYISNFTLMIRLITFCMILSGLQSIIMTCFHDTIILNYFRPHFTQRNSLFRTHTRDFKQVYDVSNCNRNIKSVWPDCVLCKGMAQIVYLPCGHLVLCKKCAKSSIKNMHKKCLICGLERQMSKCIKDQPNSLRFGLSQTSWITRKLFKNQYQAIITQ